MEKKAGKMIKKIAEDSMKKEHFGIWEWNRVSIHFVVGFFALHNMMCVNTKVHSVQEYI